MPLFATISTYVGQICTDTMPRHWASTSCVCSGKCRLKCRQCARDTWNWYESGAGKKPRCIAFLHWRWAIFASSLWLLPLLLSSPSSHSALCAWPVLLHSCSRKRPIQKAANDWMNMQNIFTHFASEKKRLNPMPAFELQNHLTCSTNFAVQQHTHTRWIFKKEKEAMEQENACRWQHQPISWHWIDQRSVNMHNSEEQKTVNTK